MRSFNDRSGFRPWFTALVGRIRYKSDARLHVGSTVYDDVVTFTVSRWVKNADAPETHTRVQIVEVVPPALYGREDCALAYIRDCIHRFELHEADEWLKVDGKKRWNPHANDRGVEA